MGRFEGARRFGDHATGEPDVQPTLAFDHRTERLADNARHREEDDVLPFADRIDRDDVRVAEIGDRFGLAAEPLNQIG